MRWARLAREVVRSASEDQLLDWAAALAFYFLFALFPGVLLLAALLSAFHAQSLTLNLVAALSRNLPGVAADLVSAQLRSLLQNHVPTLVSLDVILLLYSTSRGFAGLMTGLNAAYEVRETRPYWRQIMIALGLTFSAGVLIVLALALLLLGQRVFIIVAGPAHSGLVLSAFWAVIRWIVTMCFMLFAVAMLYRYGPNVPRHEVRRLPAVASAMIIWVAGSVLFAIFVDHFATYSLVYGSMGAVIALMLWLYIFALAILLGAETHSALMKQAALEAKMRQAG